MTVIRKQTVRPMKDDVTNLMFPKKIDEIKLDDYKGACLILIDIDDFKQFNDLHGYDGGNYVLRTFADIFGEYVPEKSIVTRNFQARGDEFCIFIPDKTGVEAKEIMVDILKKLNEAGLKYENNEINITVSAGISEYPSDGDNISELKKKGGAALKFSKDNGKNQVNLYGEVLNIEFENVKFRFSERSHMRKGENITVKRWRKHTPTFSELEAIEIFNNSSGIPDKSSSGGMATIQVSEKSISGVVVDIEMESRQMFFELKVKKSDIEEIKRMPMNYNPLVR